MRDRTVLWITLAAAITLVAIGASAPGATPGQRDPDAHDPHAHDPHAHDPHAHDPHAHDPHAHDPGTHDPDGRDPVEICATGCAAARHDGPALTPAEFDSLLAECAAGPWSGANAALETLLYHGPETARLLAERGPGPLSTERAARLTGELARDRAVLRVRLVDEHGALRVLLSPESVPLGEKQHLWPEHADGVTPPEISGTVRRVGLAHVWTRL